MARNDRATHTTAHDGPAVAIRLSILQRAARSTRGGQERRLLRTELPDPADSGGFRSSHPTQTSGSRDQVVQHRRSSRTRDRRCRRRVGGRPSRDRLRPRTAAGSARFLASRRTANRVRLAIGPARHPRLHRRSPGTANGADGEEPENPLTVAACATCAGQCCAFGAPAYAFLTVEAFQRFRQRNPGTTSAEVAAHYLGRLPERSVEESCVYHGEHGCALPRTERSDACNSYHCGPLIQLGRRFDELRTSNALIVACDEKTAPVIGIHESGRGWRRLPDTTTDRMNANGSDRRRRTVRSCPGSPLRPECPRRTSPAHLSPFRSEAYTRIRISQS